MQSLIKSLANRRIRRNARPNADALAAASGKTPFIVITGGSEGIGKAIAAACLADGKSVLLVARDSQRLEATRQALEPGHAGRCSTLSLDISNANASAKIGEAVEAMDGYVDVLVNSAGIGSSGDFVAEQRSRLDELIDLNMKAATLLIHDLLPGMLARARGGVLNIASLGAAVPGPNQAAYYASKAYLASLTEAVAHEIRGRGVRMTAILPGPVETRFHGKMNAHDARYRGVLPTLTAEFVARSALRAFERGQTISVPGTPGPLAAFLIRVVPHPISVPVTGWLLSRPRGDRRN